jgi:hypothetical protein
LQFVVLFSLQLPAISLHFLLLPTAKC